ncbi:MAG: P-loop NTPase [Spirochaetaceae bacterium]|nr:P-loop NTPase [Spirochaetaceae bacterium]
MQRLLPIASGKGGVGKSVLTANLGLALSRLGKTVVLVDLDLGASNLHTCLGIRNKHPGLGSLVWKTERSLSALLVETGYERLWLVPGDNLLPGTANLEWNSKRRILKELRSLPADFVLLDLGAGSSYNVVDFFLAATSGLLVLCPEITAVLNAYSFLKTAAFRQLHRSFPEGSPERAEVLAFAGAKTEGSGQSFLDFAASLAARSPERGPAGLEGLKRLKPRVVMNRGRSPEDAELGYRLRDISGKNLGLGLEFGAFLLEDEGVARSIAARRPLLDLDPASPFARGVAAFAQRLALTPAEAPLPEAADYPTGVGAEAEAGSVQTLSRLAEEAFSSAYAATGSSVEAAPEMILGGEDLVASFRSGGEGGKD